MPQSRGTNSRRHLAFARFERSARAARCLPLRRRRRILLRNQPVEPYRSVRHCMCLIVTAGCCEDSDSKRLANETVVESSRLVRASAALDRAAADVEQPPSAPPLDLKRFGARRRQLWTGPPRATTDVPATDGGAPTSDVLDEDPNTDGGV